jgi:hypothetical protein
MILVCELFWTGTQHAPGNSATIQTIARAFPEQQVRVFADATHLRELRADAALTAYSNVDFSVVRVSSVYPGKTHVVSVRRFLSELAALRRALRMVPAGEPVLIMLISTTPTAIFAAKLVARGGRRRVGVQVGLHGNLNEVNGWRSRNPLRRAFDLSSALAAQSGLRPRFLVLEEAIREELARLVPETAAVTDVLPLPINLTEVAQWHDAVFQAPLRIGLVGQATEAKGITPFLALANEFHTNDRVTFHLVGRAMAGDDLARFAPLADPVSAAPLSRAAFLERLAPLHFVCLPLQPGYYNLSASGALIDAITWLKPIIATRVPIVENLFRQFGDIGYLCDDMDAMRETIRRLLSDMDAARYGRQVAAIHALRESRMPDALALQYRAVVREHFPHMVTGERVSGCTAVVGGNDG